MKQVAAFKFLYRAFLCMFIVCLACTIVEFASGCTADQAARGSATVAGLQAATTQPYVTIPAAAAGPWGEIALSAATVVLGGLSLFFKSQQSAAQAHLDTAKAATGTTTNAAATAALVNNLDTTVVPVVPVMPVAASPTPVVPPK